MEIHVYCTLAVQVGRQPTQTKYTMNMHVPSTCTPTTPTQLFY